MVDVRTLYRPPISCSYAVTKQITDFARGLNGIAPGGSDHVVVPDYQRGHIWTPQQQVAYVEAKLSERIPHALDIIRLNCPTWHSDRSRVAVVDLDPDALELVDGLQRVTALIEFMQDRLRVFGGHVASELSGIRLHAGVTVNVNNLTSRVEVLRWYLQLNEGGTPHSKDELARVHRMLSEASNG